MFSYSSRLPSALMKVLGRHARFLSSLGVCACLVLAAPTWAASTSDGSEAEETALRPHVIYGLAEQVYVPALGIRLPAKIDTGAESASLSATNITRFKREDKKWVRFMLAVEGLAPQEVELPLSHNVRIRRRASDFDKGEEKDYARRAVVELVLCVGDRQALLNVNLADRRRFSQPMLLGQDALRALSALVDVNAEGAMGAPTCAGSDAATGLGDASGKDEDENEDASPSSSDRHAKESDSKERDSRDAPKGSK